MKYKEKIIRVYEKVMLLFDSIVLKIVKNHPKVLSFNETIFSIKSTDKSLCRFGDGEFAIMNGHNIKFQIYDPILAKRLKIIIGENECNLLISLPDIFLPNLNYTKKTNDYWSKEIAKYRLRIYKLINNKIEFGNSFVSRPYMNWESKQDARDRFTILFQLWEEKEILIIEGEHTRMGIGNEVFSKAKSIKRILVPSENAFFKYDDIFDSILKQYSNELILISAGPTAKLLVYDLFEKGIQALDIGHIDLEYEWFLKSVSEKIAIEGKYTSEVENGEIFDDSNSAEYLSQIVDKIT